MNYAKIAELFGELANEFSALAESDVKAEKKADKPKTTKETAEPKSEKKSAKKQKSGEVTADELNAMGFNELKKYAASVGVSATGKRDDIINRILGGGNDEEPAEEPKKAKAAKTDKGVGKKSAKKSNVVDFDEKKAENEKFEEQADRMLDEYEEDSIIDELKSVGMKAVTKKTLRAKLIEALKKGLISDEDDDDEEPVEADDDDNDADSDNSGDDDGEVIDENTYFEDYDDAYGSNNPENVTEEDRKSAMVELQGQILEDIENEDLTVDDMKEFLNDTSTEDEQEEMENYDDDDILAAYIEMRKRYIDDEGDDMSEEDDPYMVNGEVYMHGHKCGESDGKYIDEVSGEEFDLED